MSPEENSLLQRFIDNQTNVNDEIRDDMREIRRGLYGDPGNKVPGLIQRQEDDDVRLDKLEDFRKKIMWIWGIIVTGAIGGWELLGDHIKGLFR